MKKNSRLLPSKPGYQEVCSLIDDSHDNFWLPILEHIRKTHLLPNGTWIRITEGANVLFKLNQSLIIKLVPPNWSYQGSAEVESSKILAGKLSLPIPEVIANGKIDNWQYIVMTLLSGTTLAEVWGDITEKNKLSIVKQIGLFMHELHQLPINSHTSLTVDWQEYSKTLKDDCIPRHTRKNLPSELINQIPEAINLDRNYFDDGKTFFIHMDLHIWNLMVKKQDGEYKVSGILDFGDAIIGKSRLLELNTPLLFLCQGDPILVKALLNTYQLLDDFDPEVLQNDLMAVALLRPACDFNFVLKQVPETGPRNTWKQIAKQLFPV